MSFIEIDSYAIENTIKTMADNLKEIPKLLPKAQALAINRTLLSIKTQAIRLATTEYTAPAKNIQKKCTIERASAKKVYGALSIKDKPGIGLIHFSPRPAGVISWKGVAPQKRKKTVTNKIKRQGTRKVYNEKGTPFVAQVNSGKHIFVRNQQGKLERLFGPSLIYALYGKSRELEEKAEDIFGKRLQHEIAFLLSKQNAK